MKSALDTIPQREAGDDVVQFGNFRRSGDGDGTLVEAAAPLKHNNKSMSQNSVCYDFIKKGDNSMKYISKLLTTSVCCLKCVVVCIQVQKMYL